MNVFAPLTTQPPSTRSALVRIEATSEPAPGSVMPSAAILSPAIAGRSQRSCCSSVPNFQTGGVAIPVWAPSPAPTPPHMPAAAISSAQTASWRSSPPWPPSSPGYLSPRKPSSPARVDRARAGTRDGASHSSWWGTISLLDPAADRRPQLRVLVLEGGQERALARVLDDGHRAGRYRGACAPRRPPQAVSIAPRSRSRMRSSSVPASNGLSMNDVAPAVGPRSSGGASSL